MQSLVEEGTELPDVVAPNLAEAKQGFVQTHPSFEWTSFQGYARSVFHKLQGAWSEQRWEEARPYETDQLFHTVHNEPLVFMIQGFCVLQKHCTMSTMDI